MSKTVYLIGFMGAGKTSIGKKLEALWGYPVVDTDEMIVEKEKMPIPEIFKRFGEVHFRKLEKETLQNLSSSSYIVTTGGGIVLDPQNRQLLKETGRTVFLYCEPKTLIERLEKDDPSSRPLLHEKSREEMIELYESRLPLYEECASFTIDTTNLSIEEVATLIAKRLKSE